MILVSNKYGISVDDYQYISGEIYYDKNEKACLRKTRYFTRLEKALEDIAERNIKDDLKEKDCSLYEAMDVVKTHYDHMSNVIDEFRKRLEIVPISYKTVSDCEEESSCSKME